MPAFSSYHQDSFETFLQRRHFPHQSLMQLLIILQKEYIIAGLLIFVFLEGCSTTYLTIFFFKYSAAKSQ